MKVTTQNRFVLIETLPVSASVLIPHGLTAPEALRAEARERRSKAQRHLAYAGLYEQAADQLEGKPARPQPALPTWEESEAAAIAGRATALQQFIYDNEPDRPHDHEFRQQLQAVLEEALK